MFGILYLNCNRPVVASTIENGEEFCTRVCFSFFPAKPGTTNNPCTDLSDISF